MNRSEGNGRSRAWLGQLAEAIADGTQVDWELQLKTHPERARELEKLRDIDTVGQLCRTSGSPHETGDLDQVPGVTQPRVDSAQTTRSDRSMPRRHELVAPLSTWGHLSFLEKIGEGAYSEVYRAYDASLDLEVALKLLRADLFSGDQPPERLLKEARCLAQVQHPNVITVHGADAHDGLVGIWTELLNGTTLEECLDCSGPFGANEAALIGIELCSALAAIHAAGLVHGDVKTSNVMRQRGGRIVLMDFGTVRQQTPDVFSDTGGCGTPLAMAPELLLESGRPTRASDIYSLGALLYRLVTHEYPIKARTVKELVARHERGEVTPLRDRRPDLAPAFLEVVDQALSPKPTKRFATFGELERALRHSVCVQASLPPVNPRRRRRAGLAATVAAVAAVAWGAWALMPEPALEVETAFYKHDRNVETRLEADSDLTLQAGDSLFLRLESKDDMHVYVFNEDLAEPGVVNTLFPALDNGLGNPVRGGVAHRIPTSVAGLQSFWEFDGQKTELLLLVASREPRSDLEERIALEFRDGSEESFASDEETHDGNSGDSTDAFAAMELDPEKLKQIGLRRLQVRTPEHKGSTLEALATRMSEEAKHSKNVWCKIVRIAP